MKQSITYGVFGVLFALSMAGNYFFIQHFFGLVPFAPHFLERWTHGATREHGERGLRRPEERWANHIELRSGTGENGTQSVLYSEFKDGEWKTYATTTPLAPEELKTLQEDMARQEEAMREYWRKQDALMREFQSRMWQF